MTANEALIIGKNQDITTKKYSYCNCPQNRRFAIAEQEAAKILLFFVKFS